MMLLLVSSLADRAVDPKGNMTHADFCRRLVSSSVTVQNPHPDLARMDLNKNPTPRMFSQSCAEIRKSILYFIVVLSQKAMIPPPGW